MPELLDLELADDPNETHAAGDGQLVQLPPRGRTLREIIDERNARAAQYVSPTGNTSGASQETRVKAATHVNKASQPRKRKQDDSVSEETTKRWKGE
ncbi:hypothetical protein FRC06_004394 [Ceratobasidium sp. 370]|nr:hypothetical protein FRC06_004394 [Ceratobasidium sp. 370]